MTLRHPASLCPLHNFLLCYPDWTIGIAQIEYQVSFQQIEYQVSFPTGLMIKSRLLSLHLYAKNMVMYRLHAIVLPLSLSPSFASFAIPLFRLRRNPSLLLSLSCLCCNSSLLPLSLSLAFAVPLSPYNTCIVMCRLLWYIVMSRLVFLYLVLSCSCVHSLACSHAHTRSPTCIHH